MFQYIFIEHNTALHTFCSPVRLIKSTPKALIASSVAIVTFIVFLPALQNEFINWDDETYVYQNLFVRAIDMRLLKSAFAEFHEANWHPLTWISHAIDYAIWGLNPLGHHLTNNILHSLNALLVVFLVMRLMEVYKKTAGNNRLSQAFLNDRTILITGAVTGVLFGLHPLHVESVAWVAERKDLLCAFFFLLSIIKYTQYVIEINETASPNSALRFYNTKYLFAIAFFILSLLSKPMAVTLPFVLLLLDWYLFGRIQSLKTFWIPFVEKLPFIALTLISSILTILAQKAGGAMGLMQYVPLSTRVLVGAQSLIVYLGKMMVPVKLVPYYPYPENVSLSSLEYLSSFVLVIGITLFCVVIAKRQKLWLFLWGYYVITLLPVLGIVQVGNQSMADRYTYLPSLGPFLIIGVIAANVYEKVTAINQRRVILRISSLFIFLAMFILISYATIRQIGIWKNSTVFWNYVIEKEPEKVPVAYYNLGRAYESQGQSDRAIEVYQTALRLEPDSAEAHNNLGVAYAVKGQFDKAIPEYQTALRLNSDYIDAHNNLGVAYASQGHLDSAVAEFQTALRLDPDSVKAHNNLGIAYKSQGLFNKAIAEYQTALRLNPDYIDAHYNLGNIYASQGQLDRAIAEYQTLLGLEPDFHEARQRLNDIVSKRR